MKVGAVVQIGPLSFIEPSAGFPFFRDMAIEIDNSGLDSIWIYDHLLFRMPGEPTDGFWECWTMLTALAAATQRVEVGTLVICTQFRNPAVLAKMAITLDEVTNGRLILGLGAGWHAPEFTAFGLPFDHRASRFAEAISIIKPLLRDGKVDFQGKYYSARDCELAPRGPRPSGPPLLLAGRRPRMTRRHVEHELARRPVVRGGAHRDYTTGVSAQGTRSSHARHHSRCLVGLRGLRWTGVDGFVPYW
jgi:alkanesulfonate monooxygenase SsuD/methylene tetrahydromethanopterin reductase-like flavin-dependent oxidoreductase (luciferase family)